MVDSTTVLFLQAVNAGLINHGGRFCSALCQIEGPSGGLQMPLVSNLLRLYNRDP